MASTLLMNSMTTTLSTTKFHLATTGSSEPILGCTPKYPMLPDAEIFRYRNIYAVQNLIPRVMRTVLEWGCPKVKPQNMSYATYCETVVNNGSLKDFFTPCDIKKLSTETTYSSIDTVLLFKLIQSCCSNLKHKRDPVWLEADYTKLEPLLWKAKELRNDICHNIASKATSPDVFEDVLRVSKCLLEAAAQFYSISIDELNAHINFISNTFSKMTQAEEHLNKIYTQYQFCKEGFNESKSYWQRHCSTDVILFSGQKIVREQVYHPLNVSIKTVSSSTNARLKPEIASYTKIIEPWSLSEEDYNITIVKGEAGAGKSTISKNIAQQFFGLTKREIIDMGRFDMIHFLECRSRSSNSLESLIRKSYPKTCLKAGVGNIMECFGYLGHLMIVDGFDERNDYSMRVIRDVLERIKTMPNCQLVFTTRPHAARELENLLSSEGLDFRTCEIMPITDEKQQVEFLSRYQEIMKEIIPYEGTGLIECFKGLHFEVKNFFVFPINLLLFFHIYVNSDEKEFLLQNVSDVPRKILHHYNLFIKRKLEIEGIRNAQQLVDDVLEIIFDFSFKSIAEDKITILSDDMDELLSKTSNVLREYGALSDVDSRQILSIVFTSTTSPNPDSEQCFQFFHKSIQEIFASKALLKYLANNTCTTAVEMLMPDLRNQKDAVAVNIVMKK